MKPLLFSSSPPFHFEALRAIWYAPSNGADYGEVASVMSRVRPGDFESWHREWWAMTEAIEERARALTNTVSRGNALLRASNYARTAEFFLAPDDPRRRSTAALARRTFDEGLEARGVEVTRGAVPLDGAEMETIFLRSEVASAEDVLVVHGGLDSTPEELFFTIGAGALERGYHVLIWEGPGQGNVIREHGVPFTPSWERPAGLVLDALAEQCAPRSITGIGISLGGHLLARAAAYERRYDAIVLLDFFPAILEAFTSMTPGPLRGAFKRMPPWMERLVRLAAKRDPQLRWALAQASWTFGATSLQELVTTLRDYDDREWVGEIEADVYLCVGEHEHFFPKALAYDFERRLTSARSVTLREFTEFEGGHLHCRNGALHLVQEAIFDWIPTVTPRRPTNVTGPAE